MTVNVAEFPTLGQVGTQGAQLAGAPSTSYDVAVPANGAAFGTNTRVIRVSADAACHIAIGQGVTAGSTSMYFPSGHVEYFAVAPGWRLSTAA